MKATELKKYVINNTNKAAAKVINSFYISAQELLTEEELSSDKVKIIEEVIHKINNGKPIQQAIGFAPFYGYEFKVSDKVLIPRFETEELVESTIKNIQTFFNKDISILEIGTGSGCISVSLKKELPNIKVTASDISLEALKIAKINSELNNTEIIFVHSDIYLNIRGKYDLIISNPPYIFDKNEVDQKVLDNEPHLALFAKDKGLYFYKQILKESNKYLNDKGMIAFEIGYQQANDIRNIAIDYFPNAKIIIKKDLQDRDRFIFIFIEKNKNTL